jgi:hypothetical protein
MDVFFAMNNAEERKRSHNRRYLSQAASTNGLCHQQKQAAIASCKSSSSRATAAVSQTKQ